MKALNLEWKENIIVNDVKRMFEDTKKDMELYHEFIKEVLLEMWYQKKEVKKADWGDENRLVPFLNDIKIPYMNDIKRKVLPSIIANNPTWDVAIDYEALTPVIDINVEGFEWKKMLNTIAMWIPEIEEKAWDVKEYMNRYFKKRRVLETLQKFANSALCTGRAWVKVENRGIFEKWKREKQTCVSLKSPFCIYYDPRYINSFDIPYIIEINKDQNYSSLSTTYPQLAEIGNVPVWSNEMLDKYDEVRQSHGLSIMDERQRSYLWKNFKTSSLEVKEYYGLYLLEGEKKEKMYKIATMNDTILLDMEEINMIPYKNFDIDYNAELNLPTSFLRDILYLQKANNWSLKKIMQETEQKIFNKKIISEDVSDTINNTHALHPDTQEHIFVKGDAQTAKNGMVVYDDKPGQTDLYNASNLISRSIESLGLVMDLNRDRDTSWLESTLWAAKLKNQQNANVINMYRDQFEEAVREIWVLVLDVAWDLETNTFFTKNNEKDKYFYSNNELFKEAVQKYHISVEANTMSADNKEERLQSAISLLDMAERFMKLWVQIDIDKIAENVLQSMPNIKDAKKYIKNVLPVNQFHNNEQNPQMGATPTPTI